MRSTQARINDDQQSTPDFMITMSCQDPSLTFVGYSGQDASTGQEPSVGKFGSQLSQTN